MILFLKTALSNNIQKYQIAQTVIAKILYIFIGILCNTILFAQANILITEIYCNTKNIKFCNLNKTTLIEKNFELNTKYIKSLLSEQKSKKRENSITNLYQYIVYAQYVVPTTDNCIYYYSSVKKYKKYCSFCFSREQQKYKDLFFLFCKKTKRAKKILFSI